MIKKLFYFFNKNQKTSLILLFGFMVVSTFLEMIGLGFIFSIVGSLSPTTAGDNILVNKFRVIFNLQETEILSYLLIIFLAFYVIKIIFLTFYNWFESHFLFSYKEYLSSRVFKEYLNQNYSFFYNRNSSEFIRNLVTEIEQFTLYLVSLLKLLLEIIVIVGIFSVLAYFNFFFTSLISLVFLFFSFLYFFSIKEKLNKWGKERQSSIQKRIQFMQEGFDGIKIIKLLGRENFFFNKFKIYNVHLSQVGMKAHFFQGVPRLILELVGIFFVTFSLIALYYSGKSLIEITQILSLYIAASFRILPSINRIVTSLQYMKLGYPAINILYNELKGFKHDQHMSDETSSQHHKELKER